MEVSEKPLVTQSSDLSSVHSSEGPPLDEKKAADIQDACNWRDVTRLRALADTQGGFLTDELRQQAWPILLGNPRQENASSSEKDSSRESDWQLLPKHRDEDQVHLDVNRAFIYYPPDQSQEQLDRRKSHLSSLILSVLRQHPYLHYFQGYHDISQVFLLVLGDDASRTSLLSRLSILRIRDFMLPSLGPTTSQLRLLPDIIARADPKLRRHLAGVEPFYALAGTLTMYSHNIEDYGDIARLFDVLLAREPVFSIYLFAQIVIARRDELFEFDDPDMLHVVLGKVPPRMDLDTLISDSITLCERHPPETLRAWRHISSSSALKTARDVDARAKTTLEEGREYFEKQAKEIRWIEVKDRLKLVLWAYRRPARAVGVAMVVGLAAFYLRRNTGLMHQLSALLSR